MSKCTSKDNFIKVMKPKEDDEFGGQISSFGDTNPPEYEEVLVEWPADEHYWEIKGFFGKFKRCIKCGVEDI